jgi:hypothetical protein
MTRLRGCGSGNRRQALDENAYRVADETTERVALVDA